MAEVQFELTGDATASATLSQAEAGTLLCTLALPHPFVGASNVTLRVGADPAMLRKTARLTTVQLDHEPEEDIVLSVLLSQPCGTLRLHDVLNQAFFLDCILANDEVLELSGTVPSGAAPRGQPSISPDMFDDDHLVLEPRQSAAFDAPARTADASKAIAQSASAGIAQFYEDDIDDSFILR